MAGLSYLWNNRAKFPIGSKAFFKAWAKRLLLIDELYIRNRRRSVLVRQGANIATTAEIGIVKVDGKRSNLAISSFTSIGRVEFALHDKIQIGAYVCVNDGVKLLTASHDITAPTWHHVKAPIIIEDYAWIATNAIILAGVTIGRGAVVGAGAVVSKSVAPGAIVAGNPAQQISKKRSEELNYNPCAFLAVNNAWLNG
jgi:acetyltransferase-like isoleucine patch superfamily enzyme